MRPLPKRERRILERSALDGRAAGEPVAHIAKRLRVAPATIYRWLKGKEYRLPEYRFSRCEHCGGPIREGVR